MAEYANGVLATTVSGPTTTYRGLDSHDLAVNPDISDDGTGDLYLQALALLGYFPVANCTGRSIGSLLDLIALNGTCVSSSHTIQSGALITRKIDTCQDALGATPHMQHAFAKALIIPRNITASRNQDARFTFEIHALSAAGANPIAVTDGVAWPTTIVNDRYRLGVPKLGNIAFPEVDEISLDFNVTMTDKTPEPGSIYCEKLGVLTVAPQLTLRGRDLSKVKTGAIELLGNQATHANTLLQFLKVATDAAGYQAAGSSVHTTMTLAGLAVPNSLVSSSAGQRANNEILLVARESSGTAPIVIDTTATYAASP